MLLETSHNDLFAELNLWSIEAKGHSTQIQLLEEAAREDNIQKSEFPGWNFDDVKDLLLMEPYFSSVDLREIFWVSRDKLIDGMGGVTLIPKRIKEIFDDIPDDIYAVFLPVNGAGNNMNMTDAKRF